MRFWGEQVLRNGELLSAHAAERIGPPGVDMPDVKRPSVLLVGNPSLPLKVCGMGQPMHQLLAAKC